MIAAGFFFEPMEKKMTPPDRGTPERVTFLHTSPLHINTFENLRDRLAPGLKLRHVVREDLLKQAEKAGGLTPALRIHTGEALLKEAARGADVVVLTCSTLAPVAEEVSCEGTRIMRIDRPMADEAAGKGGRIAVAACLEATLEPTMELVRSSAKAAGKEIEVSGHVFFDLWPLFQKGALGDYHAAIAARLREASCSCQAILLAQASMAPAAALLGEGGIPVLSSPESGFKAALGALH